MKTIRWQASTNLIYIKWTRENDMIKSNVICQGKFHCYYIMHYIIIFIHVRKYHFLFIFFLSNVFFCWKCFIYFTLYIYFVHFILLFLVEFVMWFVCDLSWPLRLQLYCLQKPIDCVYETELASLFHHCWFDILALVVVVTNGNVKRLLCLIVLFQWVSCCLALWSTHMLHWAS